MREYCGVTGIVGDVGNIFEKVYLTLFALQHRGQEAAGIAVWHDGQISTRKEMGFVSNLLKYQNDFSKGEIAIGHVRYSTAGNAGDINNVQPLTAETNFGCFSVAHNGHLVNFAELRKELQEKGAIFQGNSDSELLIHSLAMERGNFAEKLKNTLNKIKGSYSLVMIMDGSLYGVRDPHGYRPLVYGKIPGGYIITSETCAIDILGGEYLGEVEPGTILKIDRTGNIEFTKFISSDKIAQNCVFEHIYFARPDSIVFGKNVHKMRYKMGEKLAEEYANIDIDLVIPVPDSGWSAAIGFSHKSGVPLDSGLIRNHYVGRSFINPLSEERKRLVRMKLHPVSEVIDGKKIAVVDDSMVRSTTAKGIVSILKNAGAKKIHYFLASPPIKYPCFFGIDIPDTKQLIANKLSPNEIAQMLGIDSVNYLSLAGLKEIFGFESINYCYNCFDGNYADDLEIDLQIL